MHRLRLCCIALGLFACSQSEPGPVAPWVNAITPAEHDRFFPIQSGPHALTCNTCHGGTQSFQSFDCTTCHAQAPTAALHRPETAFDWTSASCYACHSRGTATFAPADHARYFPVESGRTHAVGATAVLAPGLIGCASCHTAGSSQADCTTCHTQANMTSPSGQSFHASVPDVASDGASPQCLLCHADGSVPVSVTWSAKAPPHDQKYGFEIAPGTVHAGSKCLSCHAVTSPVAGAGFDAADFTQQTCADCHSLKPTGSLDQDIDRAHLGLGELNGFTYANLSNPPVAADSRRCLDCHPHGRIENFDHGVWFPIGGGDTHALGKSFTASSGTVTLTCAVCHQDPANRENVTCTTCHTPAGTNAAAPKPIDLGPAHEAKLAGSNWLAPAGPTPQCLLCHARDVLERVSVHGSGSPGAQGTAFIIDATSKNHFVACEQCHTARITDPRLRNPQNDFSVTTCDNCHAEAKDRLVSIHALLGITVADTVDQNGSRVGDPARQCRTCHPDGGPAPASVSYSHPYFPVGPGTTHAWGAAAVHVPGQFQCASCHTALNSDPAQVDCTACHTQAQMTTASGVPFHAAVPDLTWPSPAKPVETSLLCLKCHADSTVPASVSYSTSSTKGKHAPSNPDIAFDVTAGAMHASVTMGCLSCHETARQPFPSAPAMEVADFTQESCTNCHSPAGTLAQDLDAIHARVTTPAPGYQPLPSLLTPAYSKTCLPCHSTGQVDAVIAAQNHEGFFPIASTDSHAYLGKVTVGGQSIATACASCHVDTGNRPNVDCTGCHVESGSPPPGPGLPADQTLAHSGKVSATPNNLWLGMGPVAAGASARCLLCHANDTRPAGFVATHGQAGPAQTVFAIDPASGSHFASCDQCHSATLVDPKRANVEFDFAQANCDVCHLASGPASVVAAHVALGAPVTAPYAAGDPNNSNACLGCHPNGGQAASSVLYSHAYFPIDSGSVHAMGTAAVHAAGQFQCASCHTALTSDPAKIDCTGCHTQSQMKSSAGLAFHAAVPDLTWPAPATPQETSLLCLKCHAESNVPASVSYSTSSSKGKHDPTNAAIVFDVTTGSPHDTSRVSMPCLTCHSSATTPFPAVPAVAVADFTQQWCTACHSPGGTLAQDLDAIHVGVTTPAPGYQPLPSVATAAYSKTCLPCHADGRVDLSTAAQNHVWFPLAGADTHALGKSFILAGSAGPVVLQCATCHQDSAN
ncbi:MAG: hypothetical protein E6J63_15985, partial [Deltaproteobacteria bacterium]